MNISKDFQQLSAKQIVKIFSNGQRRVLLADEVGLGKTIVARTVVEMMHRKAKEQGQPFKVIYVCSNQGIIQQNAHKLGIDKDNVVPLSESRLSMQHKNLFMQMDNDYLIPITPSTSLKQTEGYGNANERALIYSLIKEYFEENLHERLRDYLDVYAREGHHTHIFDTNNDDNLKPPYYNYIRGILSQKPDFTNAIEGLKYELTNKKEEPDRKYINALRTLFCEISMDMLKPDLVIMDEFQRYRDLMKGSEDTEENRLAQRLFNAESNPYILLVSATPYKPMTTMEEISCDEKNLQFEDFNNLMEFLMGNKYTDFKLLWKEYSKLLGALSADKVTSLLTIKEEVEKMMRRVMVRTERYTPNLATYIVEKVMPNAEEVNDYFCFRKLIDSAATTSGYSKKPSLNIDYLKSAPYLLSFMQHYVEKKYLEDIYKGRKGPKGDRFNGLLIKEDSLKKGKKINCRNARLLILQDMAFGKDGQGMADLLWIPPSLPYYRTNSVFEKCADASKILVFSKWGFVPRMIAAMLSHEASRKCRFKNHGNNSNALDKYKELLLSPFPKLAGWYQRGDSQIDLKQLEHTLKERIRAELVPYKQLLTSTTGRGYNNLLHLAQLLNGDIKLDLHKKLYYDDKSTLDELVNLIIASPGICLWRCFGVDYGDTYENCINSGLFQFAKAFVNMLGYDESQAIISKNIHTGTRYSRTLKYCVNGNLQAMIDEYAFVMGYYPNMSDKRKKDLWTSMQSAIITRTPIEIDTDYSFCKSGGKRYPVQRWFACDYTNISNNDNDNEEKRKQSIQAAFNSPFRPFVLASTSVGQEGLDFHLYCRKIVHWNLPGNPVNLEQRSGRINRYEGLAIRRTVAHMFKDTLDWRKLFEKANNDWHSQYEGYNEMLPYWCIPKECLIDQDDMRIERIENIFPLYAMSQDIEEYSNLMKQLDLYRFTMGQPDQEFIINLLNQLKLPEDKKEMLAFDFTPKPQ